MPAKTPAEHEENFRSQAEKLGIKTKDRSSNDLATDMINAPVDKIRDLGFVGAPCTESEMLPYERPTMELSRSGASTAVSWLESQIVSGSTYDGSISYIITKKNPKRKDHAKVFMSIAMEVMNDAQALLDLYDMKPNDEDQAMLEKICRFESDIGFIAAAQSVVSGSQTAKAYLQLFDLGNPFEGYLEKEKYATHSWDIVALLGAYDDRLSAEHTKVVDEWRSTLIKYCVTGEAPWPGYKQGRSMLINKVSRSCRLFS